MNAQSQMENVYHTQSSQGSGDHCETETVLGNKKIVRVRGGSCLQGNRVFWAPQGSGTYKATGLMTL